MSTNESAPESTAGERWTEHTHHGFPCLDPADCAMPSDPATPDADDASIGCGHTHRFIDWDQPASYIRVGDHIHVPGDGHFGDVTRVEPMLMVTPGAAKAIKSDWTNEVPSQPVIKVEFATATGGAMYIARMPHEEVLLSGERECFDPNCDEERK